MLTWLYCCCARCRCKICTLFLLPVTIDDGLTSDVRLKIIFFDLWSIFNIILLSKFQIIRLQIFSRLDIFSPSIKILAFEMATRSRIIFNSIARNFSQQTGSPKPSSASSAEAIKTDVPGLSGSCLSTPTEPVGPGVEPSKSGDYKVPEYFCYNVMSYYEAEIEMSKYRLPQPSSISNN